MSNQDKVFYSEAIGIIDFVVANGTSLYAGDDLAAMKDRYPDAEILTLNEAATRRDNHFKQAPERITKEKFIEMLEILPPLHWRFSGNSESFKLSEFTCGSITSIYCRIGTDYWQLRDHYALSHEIIVDRCNTATRAEEVILK